MIELKVKQHIISHLLTIAYDTRKPTTSIAERSPSQSGGIQAHTIYQNCTKNGKKEKNEKLSTRNRSTQKRDII